MRNYVIVAAAVFGAFAASAADITGPWVERRSGFNGVQLGASANGVAVSGSQGGFVHGAAARAGRRYLDAMAAVRELAVHRAILSAAIALKSPLYGGKSSKTLT